MERYDEYIFRGDWELGQKLQYWLSKRIFQTLMKDLALSPLQDSVINMVEVGSGFGNFGRIATRGPNLKYSAIEPNHLLASRTREVVKCHVYETALPEIPEELVNACDVVIAIHVIEHAPNAYVAREWLASMTKMLKFGGKLLVVTPDILSYKGFFWDMDWSHAFPTTSRNLGQLGNDLGLSLLRSSRLRLGGRSIILNIVGWIISKLIPTHLLDIICLKLFKRPLGTGIQSALFWKNTYMLFLKEG